jgi:hypothetical protein
MLRKLHGNSLFSVLVPLIAVWLAMAIAAPAQTILLESTAPSRSRLSSKEFLRTTQYGGTPGGDPSSRSPNW